MIGNRMPRCVNIITGTCLHQPWTCHSRFLNQINLNYFSFDFELFSFLSMSVSSVAAERIPGSPLKKAKMSSSLDQLKDATIVVADTGDFEGRLKVFDIHN